MSGELSVLIVDDEPLAVERMQILCGRVPGVRLAGTASDGAAALRMIEALEPDLVLLDISMPGLSGMDVARVLAEKPVRPAVIFVTAFDSFAVQAFDVAAADYVLKPVEPARLERAIARVRTAAPAPVRQASPSPPAARAERWTREFWVPHRGELIRLDADLIERIEAERDYMRLVAGPRSFLLHATIGELEAQLDPEKFVRVHRSLILRRDLIQGLRHDGLGAWSALTADGQSWRIGRSHLARVKAIAGR